MAGNRNRKKPQQTRIGLWIIILFIFLGELLAVAWVRYEHVQTGYGINDASTFQENLYREQDRLIIELGRLKSAEHLAKVAQKLNLFRPKPEQIITLP